MSISYLADECIWIIHNRFWDDIFSFKHDEDLKFVIKALKKFDKFFRVLEQ